MCTHHTHTHTHITTHYQATQFNSQWIFSPFTIYQYAHTPYKSPDAVPHTKANILTNTHTQDINRHLSRTEKSISLYQMLCHMETTPDIQNYAMLSSNHWSQSNDVRTPFDRLEKNVAPLCRFQRLRGLSPSVVWGSPPVQ